MQLTSEDYSALESFSNFSVVSVATFPVTSYATHRLFKSKSLLAHSRPLRIAASAAIGALSSLTILMVGFSRMQSALETANTPFSKLISEKRLQQPMKRDGSDVN